MASFIIHGVLGITHDLEKGHGEEKVLQAWSLALAACLRGALSFLPLKGRGGAGTAGASGGLCPLAKFLSFLLPLRLLVFQGSGALGALISKN